MIRKLSWYLDETDESTCTTGILFSMYSFERIVKSVPVGDEGDEVIEVFIFFPFERQYMLLL